MGRFGRAGHLIAIGAPLLLAGCSSLGGLTPASTAPSAPAFDVAAAVFAVDMPDSVEPGAAPRLTYGSLDTALVPADFETVMTALPPPAAGRTYAVYALAPADHARAREVAAGTMLQVVPRICTTRDTRKPTDTVAVMALVPGQRPVTVAGPETLAALEARTGTLLAVCGGHSG